MFWKIKVLYYQKQLIINFLAALFITSLIVRCDEFDRYSWHTEAWPNISVLVQSLGHDMKKLKYYNHIGI